MTTRQAAIGIIFAGTIAIGIAYGSAFMPAGIPTWGPWSMALGTSLVMLGAMLLGVARPGVRLGALWLALGATFALCFGCFGAALLLPPETAGSPLLLGLPRRAAILMYGLGVLPLLFLPAAYAATFDRVTLSEGDLARVREAAARARAAGGDAR